ncbi:MAG TPA: guanylate kinase [Bacteroidia bacterium]|nr:guanylate kinase [Bacteroidia bacterium]
MSLVTNSQKKMLLFCGPSGSGKTTIVHYMLTKDARLKFSVSATTRQKRNNEADGKDYHFISVDDFRKKISQNEFIEWEQVYENGYYGTLRNEVERILGVGKVPVFDLDVEGGQSIKKQFGEKVLALFVCPPDIEELKHRLTKRATETEESLKIRLDKAIYEMTHAEMFDKILININKDEAYAQAEKWVNEFLSK